MSPRSKAEVKADNRANEPAAARVDDDAAVSAVLDQLAEGVAALPEVLEQGEKARRQRADATRELLASPELKKFAAQSPDIRKKITSARKAEDGRDAAAEQSIAELSDAAQEWLAAVKSLRDLGG